MKKISDRLNKALKIRQMKPIELSEKSGIDKGSLSSYLSGRYNPKSKNIYKMAKVLNVDPTWLLGYDVPMERESLNNLEDIESDNLTLFLKDIKYEDIEKIIKKDTTKKLISYINFYDIILNLYPSNINLIDNNYKLFNENYEDLESLVDKIQKLNFQNQYIKISNNLTIEELESSLFLAKRNKLFYYMKKYYTKNDILLEIDRRNIFEIVDKKGNRIDNIDDRLNTIQYFIDEMLSHAKK